MQAFHHQFELARVHNRHSHQFKKVIHCLKAQGSAYNLNLGSRLTATGEEDIQTVLQHFTDNPHDSLRKAAAEWNVRQSTVLQILKTKIKMKPYEPSIGQVSEERHKEGRRIFCKWLLEQPDNFPENNFWQQEMVHVVPGPKSSKLHLFCPEST